MAQGTLTVGDLLAEQKTIAELGEDRVFESIDMALEIHNDQVREMVDDLVDYTTDQEERYGGPDAMTMDEVDDFGRADAQKVSAGTNVGFPLGLTQVSVQWNRRYFENATGREFAEQFVAVQDADARKVMQKIRQAFFTPTNSTQIDRLVNNAISLPVKALVNADGMALPIGPDGTTFNGGSHTHYLATSSLTDSDIQGLINTVAEHYGNGRMKLYINRAQEPAVRALNAAGQFVPIQPVQVMPPTTAYVARGQLDTGLLFDRAIGIYGNQAAEVWVKPWIPSGYMLCFIQGPTKPLRFRVRRQGAGNLVIAAEDEAYPLRARTLEREFGVGVRERTNGAVLYVSSASYAAPVFAA